MKTRNHCAVVASTALMIATFAIAVHAEQDIPTSSVLANAIMSESYDIRTKVCESIIKAYSQSTDEQKAQIRSRYTDTILSMLNAPVGNGEDWSGPATPRNLAVQLAGALKVTVAIPRLIELLRPLNGERIKPTIENALTATTTGNGSQIAPSAKALIQIGDDVKADLEVERAKSVESLNDSSVPSNSMERHYRSLKLSNIRYVTRVLQDNSARIQ